VCVVVADWLLSWLFFWRPNFLFLLPTSNRALCS
jgi:hypothetical protein